MTLHIRAHFDGRVLVPDQPVDLPVNQPLDVQVSPCGQGDPNGQTPADSGLIDQRRRRLRASAGILSGPVLSNEAMRRENLYDERA